MGFIDGFTTQKQPTMQVKPSITTLQVKPSIINF